MTTTTNVLKGPTVDAARALIPMIREAREEIDRLGHLPEHVVEALREIGVWRMTQPSAWGGPETDIMTQFAVLEALAEGDGSVGWVAYIGSTSGYWSSLLEDEVGRELYPDLDLITGGALPPQGRAVREGDGYRINGRWRFGSAIKHSSYMISGCLVVDTDGRPVLADDGDPTLLACFVPTADLQIEENWDTLGLVGTGSHDYLLGEYYVAAAHTFDPFRSPQLRDGALYGARNLLQFGHSAVALGLARAAIDDVIAALETKTAPDGTPVAANGSITEALARAEAAVGSARSYCLDVVSDVWNTLVRGEELSVRQRALYRLAIAHAHDASLEAIRRVVHLAGTSAIRVPGTLERSLRDATTAGTHMVASIGTYQGVGGMLVGRPAPDPFF
jgi:alkylation response protein AidB-like acyl-CoA dehydrogenase